MKEYFDCLILSLGAAFGVGAAIFLLTILLVSKRVVGFVLSVILMLVALGVSWSVNNEALVREYLHKWIPSVQSVAPATKQEATQAPLNTPPAVQQTENLKGQVEAQKARVDGFLDEAHPSINPTK